MRLTLSVTHHGPDLVILVWVALAPASIGGGGSVHLSGYTLWPTDIKTPSTSFYVQNR